MSYLAKLTSHFLRHTEGPHLTGSYWPSSATLHGGEEATVAQRSSVTYTRLQLFRALRGAWDLLCTFPAPTLESAISPRISQCLLLESGILNQHFGARHASGCLCVPASRPSQRTELGISGCIWTRVYPYIYIYFCIYFLHIYIYIYIYKGIPQRYYEFGSRSRQ